MYRANVQRTGVYQTQGVRQLHGIKWSLELPIGLMYCYPAVGEGILCLVGSDQHLYAIDLLSRKVRWNVNTGSTSFSSPVIADGLVYITDFTEQALLALDLRTGAERWQIKTDYTPAAALQTSVAIQDGILYTGLGDGNLYALAAQTGEFLWGFNTRVPVPLSPPAIANGVLCINNIEGDVYGVDLTHRQLLWHKPLPAPLPMLFTCPAIAAGVVYLVGGDGHLYALSLRSGEVQWRMPIGALTSVAICGDWFCVGQGEGNLFAVNQQTAQTWTLETGHYGVNPSPVIADGVVYFGDRGPLIAVDLQTGKRLWEFAAPDSEFDLFRPQNWGMQLLDQIAKFNTEDRFTFSGFSVPVVSDGMVYVGSSYGHLYALH
uniref:Pyrrolo-quinoline quinone n=1 Tax=Cyanothece sp. (strain PCC 7425 / ATCC 29141) TaxID=395961 RepID=B8HLL1_CYAP4